MEKTKFERGKSLTYPHYFPTLTFTPIFGRRGDFVWVEEVKGAWPEYDSEFTFVRSTVHDQRVDSLKAENAKLRELVKNALTYIEYEGCGVECPETGHGATLTPCDTCNRYETESCAYVIAQSARELGVEAG